MSGSSASSKRKVFLRRLRGMSFDRMNKCINDVHREFGVSRAVTFADMVWCALHYKVGYLDYRTFGFAVIHGAARKTYMTMGDNIELVHRVNDPECYVLFDDKVSFNKLFADYIGREWIDLNECDEGRFAAFCEGRSDFFAKNAGIFGGKGVEKIDLTGGRDLNELYSYLKENGMTLCEQRIIQHHEMSRLCPISVNTIRMATLIGADGEPHLLYSLLRMSGGGNNVDNISSGGMYVPVGDDGVVTKPAFRQNYGEFFEVHPISGESIVGFTVPYFEEAKALVKKAALVEPRMRYVGWDVAITEDGPILVEGNNFPSYDMVQTYGQQEGRTGILPLVREILAEG